MPVRLPNDWNSIGVAWVEMHVGTVTSTPNSFGFWKASHFKKDNNQKKTMSPLRQYDTPYSNGDIGLSHCKASKGTFNGNTVVVASKKEGKTMNTLQSKKKKIAALFAVIYQFSFSCFFTTLVIIIVKKKRRKAYNRNPSMKQNIVII